MQTTMNAKIDYRTAPEGALPKRGTFEFRVAGTDEVIEVITGKIGPGLNDPGAINRHLELPTEKAEQGRA
jgi:hypothetical protein